MKRTWMVLCLLMVPGVAVAQQPSSEALNDLQGTWTGTSDGLFFTLEVMPMPAGNGWMQTQMLDENNSVLATTFHVYRPHDDTWMSTWINRDGRRSTFIGKATDTSVAVEQVAFDGKAFDVVRARQVLSFESADRFTMDWQSRPDAQSPWEPRPEPALHERDLRPAPPDEGRIAYLSKRDGNFEIYTVRPDGTDLRRVTNHPAGDHYPRWIAGGRRLAFRTQRARDDGAWDRWECDWTGGNAVASTWPQSLYQPKAGEFPEISPNGGYVLYVEEVDGDQEIFRARSGGGGETRLTEAAGLDYRPRWSPDGESILFVSERTGDPEIYVMSFDGGTRRLTSSPGRDRYHQWSPDGQWIAFASDRADSETLEIYVMRADGSDVTRLTDNDVEDDEPSWSPDGNHLCYRSSEGGASEVWVVDIATRKRRAITQDSGYAGEPVWSPAVQQPTVGFR